MQDQPRAHCTGLWPMVPDYFQWGRLHTLSGQPVPVFCHCTENKFFLIKVDLPVHQFLPIACNTKQSLAPSFWQPSFRYWYSSTSLCAAHLLQLTCLRKEQCEFENVIFMKDVNYTVKDTIELSDEKCKLHEKHILKIIQVLVSFFVRDTFLLSSATRTLCSVKLTFVAAFCTIFLSCCHNQAERIS